jgi:hypothetical protein
MQSLVPSEFLPVPFRVHGLNLNTEAGQRESLIEYLIPTNYVASLKSDSEFHIDTLSADGFCRSAC